MFSFTENPNLLIRSAMSEVKLMLLSFVTVAFRRRHNFFRRKKTLNSFALRCFNIQGSRARKQNVGIHIYHISNMASFRDGTQQVIKKTPNRKTAPMGIIARRYQRKKLIMQNLLYTLSNIFLAIIRNSSISFRFSCPKLTETGINRFSPCSLFSILMT